MAFNRSLRHHSLRARDVLPFYDSVFAVAFTLLAFNLPDRLGMMGGTSTLLDTLAWYGLSAVAVFLYWLKLRRLVVLDRFVQLPQLGLISLGLLTVVLVPKLASLVLRHGVGAGSLLQWTLAQVVNTTCLGFLFLFNFICLLYAISLQIRRSHRRRSDHVLQGIIATQVMGMAAMLVLVILELSFSWFDNQYIYLLPLILFAEEVRLLQVIDRRQVQHRP
ncbi:MAG: TMEM175 family protein [Synechococcaceae cyanobacterium ELA739]|jgi:hypothetical protein